VPWHGDRDRHISFSRRVRWEGHVASIKILVGKPERMRPLGRSRRKCDDSIGMDLRGIGLEDVDRMHLAQGREW
jgi:hypothetical protein